MQDVAGKTAVITGAASGIGRGIAEALGAAHMKLVLADMNPAGLDKAEAELRAAGCEVRAVVTDTSRPESVAALEKAATDAFGKVHVLCNNAGIALGRGNLWENRLEDWEAIRSVNLDGVLHGVCAFLPGMIAHGEEGHVVNTASIAGLLAGADSGLYTTTKFAVVGMSETLYLQLQMTHPQLSASVLCPAWVNTSIVDAIEPAAEDATPRDAAILSWVKDQVKEGLDPRNVGDQVLDAIRTRRFYILTHPTWTEFIEARNKRVTSGENPQMMMMPGTESLMRKLMEVV